jgi:hypothetical protein
MSRIDHRYVSALRGCWNGMSVVRTFLNGRASVESREIEGQPATHTTPAPAATEHAYTGTLDSLLPVTAS